MNCLKDEIWYLIASSDEEAIKEGYILRKNVIDDKQLAFLNKIGYYEADNKYIFDLTHYTDEFQQEKKAPLRQPYIEITFKYSVDIFNKLGALRGVLEYKYELTKMLREDIEKGAVKSAIQARATHNLIQAGKTVSHNSRSDFLQSLASVIVSEMNKFYSDGNNCDKVKTLITILFDNMIAYAHNLLVLSEYYGQKIDVNEQPFQRMHYPIEDKKLIECILGSIPNEGGSSGINELNNGVLILGIDDKYKKTLAEVFLAGIILKFIENAECHGEKRSLKYAIKVDDEDIIIKFTNNIKKGDQRTGRGMTKRFFVEYIGLLNSSKGYEIKMYNDKANNMYISELKICNKNIEQESPMFENILNGTSI